MLEKIRKSDLHIVAVGNHVPVIQSVLDFDYICGKDQPSVIGIVTKTQRTQKFFWGASEISIPCYPDLKTLKTESAVEPNLMLNLSSARGAFTTTEEMFEIFPDSLGGHVFCENFPEKNAIEIISKFSDDKLLLGPSGVGLLIPGKLKLGAIGGITPEQIISNQLDRAGSVAVIVLSGGLTNECLTVLHQNGIQPSFAASVGGEQFPLSSTVDLIQMAEKDPETKSIVYVGELGGTDEYEVAKLLEAGKISKPLHVYISGHIGNKNLFDIQFGHAGALLETEEQSAAAKTERLKAAGAITYTSFSDFAAGISNLPKSDLEKENYPQLENRQHTLFSSRNFAKFTSTKTSYAENILKVILSKDKLDKDTTELVETIFSLLIDHGAHVSGAVNTMISARAGRDMSSSVSAGLLTVGDRFGGAINAAAKEWFYGVENGLKAHEIVSQAATDKRLIPGIGHKKYRVDLPDPRVTELASYADRLSEKPHYNLARSVESFTTEKKATLILNVDGVIAALLIDFLIEKEGLSKKQLKTLFSADFFNAFFIIPRTVGLIAHYIEQKKIDEGLFRLPDSLLNEFD